MERNIASHGNTRSLVTDAATTAKVNNLKILSDEQCNKIHEINFNKYVVFYFYFKFPHPDSEIEEPGNEDEKNDQDDISNQESSSDNDTRRLYGSRDAKIEDYPYVVSIQKGDEHWCAGALLNPRIVITTANCVWK